MHRPVWLEWVAVAPEAVRLHKEAGIPVIVTTDQFGVPRGYFGQVDVRHFRTHMQDKLRA